MRTETTVRHTKCGRMRGMVVGGGRSSGVLLYFRCKLTQTLSRPPTLCGYDAILPLL